MRKRERSRRTAATALTLVVAGGAMILALGGCGQSGPLYLPKESSLSLSAPRAPASAPGFTGPAAARTTAELLARA